MLLCGLLVLSPAVLARAPALWYAQVTHVTDGDTIWVQPDSGGQAIKVRIDGIDAPEICQVYGMASRDALVAVVLGRHVQVRSRSRDDYGRVLARLYLGTDDVGGWMVAQGHAWSYRSGRSLGPYAEQESSARQRGMGLWQYRAMSPRTFRKRHGSCHE